MSYVGDFRLGDTLDVKFCTVTTTGAPTQLAGSPVISAYPGNSTTQLTAGITLSVDFDSVTGLNNVRVVATSGNGYATATNYQLVITTGTVGGTSVVGYVVAQFSIENRSAVMPTTAARTLDVSAGGEAGVDWANVGSPTTALNLSGTSTKAVEPTVAGRTLDVAATGEAGVDFSNINGTLDAAEIGTGAITAAKFAAGAIDAAAIADGAIDAATFAAGAINAAAIAADAITAAKIADAAIDAATFAAGAINAAAIAADAITDAKVAADVTIASVTGAVGSVAAGGITAASLAADTITAAKVAADVTDEIWAKACTEPAGVPAINASAIAVLSWLLALSRNKVTQTSTTQTLRNDADNASLATSAVSDDGTTFTRAEWA